MSKVVLGRGLEALIPTDLTPVDKKEIYRLVPVDQIAPNPLQPRRDFDEESLRTLADSVKRDGLIQPLVVRQQGNAFTIIAGERRWRAARLAGLTEVPVVLLDDVDEARMLELALVENLQREDLNPLETAEGYHTLIDRCGLTQNDLAHKVGKSRTAVANTLRLLNLPETVKAMIREGRLSEGHARALLAVESEARMLALAEKILAESWTVRDAEREARKSAKRRRLVRRQPPHLAEAETILKQTLGTSVRIHQGRKKGRIEIEFYGDSDLERLLELLRRIGS
ncbi:MAG TPA: ParB/RepB/Spo0J family partition protein [Candidatus Deferrimicrobium sp.]|nr:ParB/RepB/Spo0J family partition protein [Candidatus Deferrimicrobium sp.]